MSTKTAFIAIVGRPNIGKSTLTNALVGEKVAIVTSKPQTTRNRITGILTLQDTQLVFLDTPGWHRPFNRLSSYMVQEVKESLSNVELALFVTDGTHPLSTEEKELLRNLFLREIPTILVLNKIDLVKEKEDLIPKIHELSQAYNFAHVIPLSAKTKAGVDTLLDLILPFAQPGEHYFDSDFYTDQPERVLISEMIREKVLFNLQQELPHGTMVIIEDMTQREDKPIVDIHATIVCEKASHKGMIIGKQGKMLKKIGAQSREDIELFLGSKVFLELWVRVKEDWRNSDKLMKQLGF